MASVSNQTHQTQKKIFVPQSLDIQAHEKMLYGLHTEKFHWFRPSIKNALSNFTGERLHHIPGKAQRGRLNIPEKYIKHTCAKATSFTLMRSFVVASLEDPFWSLLVPSGPSCSILVHSGPFRSVLVYSGPIWSILVHSSDPWVPKKGSQVSEKKSNISFLFCFKNKHMQPEPKPDFQSQLIIMTSHK